MGICASGLEKYRIRREISCHIDNPPKVFCFRSLFYAYCLRVVDGDTIRVLVKFQGSVEQLTVRLSAIDAPEMKSSDQRERDAAQASKAHLARLIENKFIWLQCDGSEKFGRTLGTIRIMRKDAQSINQRMIQDGHAIAYDGGNKAKAKAAAVVTAVTADCSQHIVSP